MYKYQLILYLKQFNSSCKDGVTLEFTRAEVVTSHLDLGLISGPFYLQLLCN